MKKKFLLISLVIVLVVSALVNTVSAQSFTVTMTPSTTTVGESQELTVTVKVSNIDAGTYGINTVNAVLSYDTKVFEALTAESIEALNSWDRQYTVDNGKITVFKTSWVNSNEDIFQITLKTKAGTTGKSGSIKLTGVTAANAESTINASDVSTIITVGSASSSPQTNTSGNTANPIQPINTNKVAANTNVANKTNTSSNTNVAPQSSYIASNNTVNNTNVTAKEDIPYTGASDNIMIAIFVVLGLAAISYFKYESIKER